jgi:hypothetical protein
MKTLLVMSCSRVKLWAGENPQPGGVRRCRGFTPTKRNEMAKLTGKYELVDLAFRSKALA